MAIVGTSSTDQRIKDQSDEVPLDINELANSLREQLKIKKAFSACCIYRVPERLRKLNAEAYTPRVVSIGPIHHGKENLKAMEDHKIMYLQQFLERSKVSLEGLCKVIKDNEKTLRDCYAETTGLNDAEFVTMILLDAVFICMFLVKWKHKDSKDSRDQIFFPPWKLPDVIFDLCLLENQLPYFILEKLYNLSCVDEECTVIKLTGGLLERHCPEWVKRDSWNTFISSEILHFVDFLRKCQQHTPDEETSPTATNWYCPAEQTSMSRCAPITILEFLTSPCHLVGAAHNPTSGAAHNPTSPCHLVGAAHNPTSPRHPVELSPISSVHLDIASIQQRPAEQTENVEFITCATLNPASPHHPVERSPILSVPTASQLHQSGVEFITCAAHKLKLSKEGKLCGIQFNNGILEIPQLEIHDGTEILLRNLQAFEQCHHLSEETFVSDYITFMNCLVRAPDDVEVLVQNKILKNMLSSNEAVSSLFHNLDKENIVTNRFLLGVCNDLDSHCRKRRHKWKAALKQEYFKNPWTGISVIAATFLLILTTVQTVCSILQL